MKVAFPMENGRISAHFGHAPEFVIVEIEAGKEISRKSMTPPQHEPGVLPKWLGELGINIMIAGGMGSMAANLFKSQGIEIMTGVAGTMEENIAKLAAGSLKGDGSICSHEHGHE